MHANLFFTLISKFYIGCHTYTTYINNADCPSVKNIFKYLANQINDS